MPDYSTSFFRFVVSKGEGGGEGVDWELNISRCKLLRIGWINNKVILHSTWKCIQYPLINHNRKGHGKKCICIYIYSVYVYLSHFSV